MNLMKGLRRVAVHRYQPETLVYKANLGSLDIAERSLQHVDKFVRDCKEAGVWSKLLEVMPFAGSGFLSATIKLKYVTDSSVTLVNFVAGDYSETTGLLGDGATKYVNTNFNAAVLGAACHGAAYVREDVTSAQYWLGVTNGGATERFLLGSTTGSNAYALIGGNSQAAIQATNPVRGFYYAERTSATNLTLYRDNAAQNTNVNAVTPSLPSINFYAFAGNTVGTPVNYVNKRISFISFGEALSAQERGDYYNAVRTLQVNLGRAV